MLSRQLQSTQKLFSAEQVRTLDRRAIETGSLDGYDLMQTAAAAVARLLRFRWPAARQIAVLCGPGNNGGDGLVIARLLQAQGLSVRTGLACEGGKLQGDARSAYDHFIASGSTLEPLPQCIEKNTDVIVDALFGSGLCRELTGDIAALVKSVNQSSKPVLAVDVPSGICSDTGAVLGCAINADATVTFIGRKRGLFTAAGPDYCGKLFYDDLGVSAGVINSESPSAISVSKQSAFPGLTQRPANYHKGLCGHVLVVGGNRGYAGAAQLAGHACLRTGSGRVTVACHPDSVPALYPVPELMTHPLESASDLPDLISRCDVIAVGPGMGQNAWAREMLDGLLDCGVPMVLDADALNLVSTMVGLQLPEGSIITPHPAEAARLLGCDAAEVQRDRFTAARTLFETYGAVSLLKGNGTLVHTEQGVTVINSGNPGMATAGMGDVLTGVIASVLGQGEAAGDAAVLGGLLHAQAGDRAAARNGIGLTAGDVIAAIAELLA